MSEYRHGRLECPEISLDRHLRLSRHDALTHPLGNGFQMHAERIDAGVFHPLKPDVVVGRFALSLDRKIDGSFDAKCAFAQDLGATAAARRLSRCPPHGGHPTKSHGATSHFAELLRRLAFNGTAGGKGLADGAELA